VLIGNSLPTFQENVLDPSPSVKNLKVIKNEPIDGPETSVRNYHYPLFSSPEECSSNLLRGGSLKSRETTQTLREKSDLVTTFVG
jgi:hypothetical protein